MPNVDVKTWVATPSNYGILFESIAVCTLLFGGVSLVVRLRTKLSFQKQPPLAQGDVTCKEGEFILALPRGDQAIIYSSKVNEILERSCNPIAYEPKVRFKLHPIVEELLPVFILKMREANWDTSDDPKVRLNTDLSRKLLEDQGQTISLEKTSYFRDRLSNTLANYIVRLDGRQILNLRNEVVENDGTRHLVSRRKSLLSNHLGGITFLITRDAVIIYQRQGNRTAENQGRLAPAGSGSFDLPKGKNFDRVASSHGTGSSVRSLRRPDFSMSLS